MTDNEIFAFALKKFKKYNILPKRGQVGMQSLYNAAGVAQWHPYSYGVAKLPLACAVGAIICGESSQIDWDNIPNEYRARCASETSACLVVGRPLRFVHGMQAGFDTDIPAGEDKDLEYMQGTEVGRRIWQTVTKTQL